LRTLIIALAATLVGCSRQPPYSATTLPCTSEQSSCLNSTAADQPSESPALTRPIKEAKFTMAAKAEKPASHRPVHAAHRAVHTAHHATKKTKPPIVAAKARRPAQHLSANATKASNTGNDPHPTVGRAPNPGRTIPEQMEAAVAVAERMTVAATDALSPNADLLVAVLMVRSEITSVSDLVGKDIAIDDRHSAFGDDVRFALVAAGAPLVQLSAGHSSAVSRLVNGEVPAALVALVSADAAEGLPEIAGYRLMHIPLSPRSSLRDPP